MIVAGDMALVGQTRVADGLCRDHLHIPDSGVGGIRQRPSFTIAPYASHPRPSDTVKLIAEFLRFLPHAVAAISGNDIGSGWPKRIGVLALDRVAGDLHAKPILKYLSVSFELPS